MISDTNELSIETKTREIIQDTQNQWVHESTEAAFYPENTAIIHNQMLLRELLIFLLKRIDRM